MKHIVIFVAIFCLSIHIDAQNFGLSVKDNKLIYTPDALGNRILDFSFCGYKSSEKQLPDVPNQIFVPLREGDASDIIQRSINYVAGLKPDANGFRGAVLLDSGTYYLDKSLVINTSGVVLRGKSKTGTVLVKRGFDRMACLKIEGQNTQKITDTILVNSNYFAVNSREIPLSNTSKLKIGDRVKIYRPSTKEWIASIGCNIFGGGESALGWKPGDTDLYWDRTVIAVTPTSITIDAPLTVALDGKFGGGKVLPYSWTDRISECGVENLTLISDYNRTYPKDEDHCWTAVSIENAENCWVRRVNFRHFAGNAVILQPTASHVTVEDCISKEPVSEIGGFRRMTFFNLGQLNLFQRCYSENGIHDFAVGSSAPGPNAFVQCDSKESYGFSGATDAWACGLLYDVVNIDGHNLAFKNLGQSKNGAGWNTANSLFWQCTAAEIECYSPADDAKNRAYGCWSQYSGDGEWAESDNHVQPRSLFYAQLNERLAKEISSQAAILPRNTNASSSPTVEAAREMVVEARKPRLTLEVWINSLPYTASTETTGIFNAEQLKSKPMRVRAYVPTFAVENGKLACDGKFICGAKTEAPWWSGKTKFNHLARMKPDVTRFVPGREGTGLTDRIDSVINFMNRNNIAVFDHNYGLWYDRRRDDHLRVRRRDGDVWTPFYEQAFARSGQSTAWDGLSKYDLNRPNEWYWSRLKEFADKALRNGKLLFHENFFQHNIIEAGAHWVDSPWRTANNINDLGFPEPVNFAGDKRVFMAEFFYDLSNENRKNAYRNYIKQGLNTFENNTNVVQLISAEYTGPLHFMQFWLDVIAEWQRETGKNALVALSCTKDVQDAILADEKRAAVVDIIDIRYWHYKTDGVYAPAGGVNLAPRQHARIEKVGKVTFAEAYKAVNEYRTKYPDKAVTYYAQNYPEISWAAFMAGGSLPQLNLKNEDIIRLAASKDVASTYSKTHATVEKSDNSVVILAFEPQQKLLIRTKPGKYELFYCDVQTGETKSLGIQISKNSKPDIVLKSVKTGLYLLKKQ